MKQVGCCNSFEGDAAWVILSPIEQSIKQKIEAVGTPLKDWDIQINYGIKTGCNEAFIVSTEKRNEILANSEEERKRTEELIRPILRGRDIKRYGYNWAGLYLIATFPSRHYDIEQYPAVRDYLLSFGKERLEQTGKVYTVNGEKVKARKKTNNKWFETQDSISYWDEIIELLKEQLRVANDTVSSLTTQVNELIERIKSLEELLVQKGIAIDKANRQNKALGKLVSGKKSERQEKNPQDSMTQEEFDKKKKEQAEKRKARKNNGAKRDMHYEMKEVHVTIDPVMDAELLKTLRLFGTRTCIRYSMEPIKFIKTVYHINTYTDGSIMYPGKTPPALLLNSSYSPSFAAGLLQMRYIYSMPVERIIKYFGDNGFTLRKATANKLIARSADVLENFYKAICQVVLQQDYVSADETYHKVLLAKTKPTDKGSKKGYLWAVSAPKLGLVFFVYEDGSRSEQVILNVFSDYKGTIQSDAYAPYRKLESDAYPDIMRIACLQHVKRDFIDCGKEDKDAQEVVDIINRFYREDKKHKVGVNGWTVEDHLAYRQSYAPDILQDLLEKLEEISSRKDLLPKSTLAQAVGYALNEYNAICDIFKRGDTALDNNYIERIQRYISLSRRNSMFFGSHEGARRGAILYSIAISCKLNGINLFEYISDVIEKTIEWQPNTPLEKYRDLLPDRWKKQ